MSYVGNTPTTQNFISGTDYFNGTGSQTAFTLSRTVASVNDIQAVVNNVVQIPNDAYTISGTTITFTSAPSAGTNNVYVRYLSTTTQAITPSQNTVSWNTLDSNVQQDLGLMYKNKIINGNMVIDQRNAGASVTVTDTSAVTYALDRWFGYTSVSSKFSLQQNAGSVTPPAGFTNYLGVTSLAATTVNSGDFYFIGQYIEGFNTADLNWGTANAKTVTISFWVRSSLTGTFGGSLTNSAINRSYPFSFSISSANTWQQKSITITGDTTGTWVGATNGVGLRLFISLGIGSTYSTTAGAWASGDYRSTTGAVNVVSTNGATFYLTGVQLEVGTQATAFSTAGGSYGAELALCQRYFWMAARGNGVNEFALYTGIFYNGSQPEGVMKFPVSMRTTPTAYISNSANSFQASNGGYSVNLSTLDFYGGNTEQILVYRSAGASTTNGIGCRVSIPNASSAFIGFSAEL